VSERSDTSRLSCLLIGIASAAPVVYPLWLAARSRLKHPPVAPRPQTWPGLSVVVPAYLEREVIGAKVADVLAQEYPGPLQLLVVAEDPETAEAAAAAGAEVIEPESRVGKCEAINRAVAASIHPIVVITDANTRLAPGSLAALARWFDEPAVGAVAGEKREEGGGQGLYWRFESWLKVNESRSGTTIALVGELAAVRRSIFRPLPEDVVVDDLWMGLDVIEEGYEVRYEPEAIAVEEPSGTLGAEWERRTRTTLGAIDVMWRRRHLLVPGSSPVAAELWGHKLMRLVFGPLAHAGLLLLALVRSPRSRLARLFVAGHLLGMVGLMGGQRGGILMRPARIIAQVLFLQASGVGGAIRYARGDRPALWPKAERPEASGRVFEQDD
jgi:cellulose synthase/poly-beta-1,6-N-acetylglucosamine synthase-like glycosyltransferase